MCKFACDYIFIMTYTHKYTLTYTYIYELLSSGKRWSIKQKESDNR